MRVIVVGAGLAGLAAARELHRAGHDTTVFDKGRSPGGRLATRRIGGATLDHGAQFFTVRGAALAEQVAAWESAGLVRVWCEGFDETGDGHPRYVATGGMTSLAKDLATGLDVRCDVLVFAVRHGAADGAPWEVVLDDGTVHGADAVVVTCPLPQTFALLFEAGVELPRALFGGDYDRTLALLAVLDGPGAVPSPGGVQADRLHGTIFSFIGDNHAKGVSALPALTLHAEPAWSEAHWDDEPAVAHAALLEAAAPWFGDATVVESQLKRWRFATPRRVWPDPCWIGPDGRLVLAGDAFAGPKFEGAYVSGLAAASALTTADLSA
jgi:predicted NAD/FAD-dependent oxidoreductase